MSVSGGRRGSTQKKKIFEVLSERQKSRRAETLMHSGVDKLLLAAAKTAKDSNQTDLEYVLKLLYKDNKKATLIRSLLKAEKSVVKPEKMDPLRGLTYLLDNKLTTSQYNNTRLISKEYGSNAFPSYKKIAEAKNECRPSEKCKVNDVSTTLPLQELLNHTAVRLLMLQEPVLTNMRDDGIKKITVKLQGKWGCDGSSDHSQYNQKYVNVESTTSSDANFFATTLVPLRMTTTDDSKTILWNNSTPQSPRFCRPLRLHFAKETDEFCLKEIDVVQSEIAALNPFVVTIAGVQVEVVFELYLTMIDGKTLATITKTKSKQCCCICGATPKQFNELDNMEVRFKPKDGTLNYGLSVLHLWIRSFEWLLHVSYRKGIKKWQARGAELKKKVKDRKILLQKRFKKKLGLRVDYPSTKGTGNSNNGNLCRVAFSKPEELSKILGVSKKLIINIRVILIALSCQLPLNIERFHNFCKETAEHYVEKYYWYKLPASIHKVLIHSRDIMLANDLTVGVLAEDASESCNKLYRYNRLFHARKNSRKNNLEDVFNRALDSSDPIVASFGLQNRQKSRFRKNIPHEVLSLLQAPDEPTSKCHEEGGTENLDATETDTDGLTEEFTEILDRLNLEYDDDDGDDDDGEDDGGDGDDGDGDDGDGDDETYVDDDEEYDDDEESSDDESEVEMDETF